MSAAAKSLFVFGIYAVVAGTGLLGSLVVASVMPTPLPRCGRLLLFAKRNLHSMSPDSDTFRAVT